VKYNYIWKAHLNALHKENFDFEIMLMYQTWSLVLDKADKIINSINIRYSFGEIIERIN
jgi:hypothetical protein